MSDSTHFMFKHMKPSENTAVNAAHKSDDKMVNADAIQPVVVEKISCQPEVLEQSAPKFSPMASLVSQCLKPNEQHQKLPK